MTLLNPVIMEECLSFDRIDDLAANLQGNCEDDQNNQALISREKANRGERLNQKA
ncbi:hypothetical protein [Aestuariispira insulae]|uniref:Uncharacterized protein n=1 Tax=Aestuariispira insulae TaxID=1461337 RepID=A0A3D9HPV3_9PROT|nr:hypothetical protein [Aestuariispira insulae]RED51543.1 hypothetical protein DFP90_103346 [Aestuariispira insulae]